jgi:RNA polymerase sigma-70 factor (ECF subfamily)
MEDLVRPLNSGATFGAGHGEIVLEMFLNNAACVEYKTSQPPEVYEKMNLEELLPKIKKALSKLSEHHKEAFELSILEGLEYKEIAKKIKVPVGTVMSRIFYARQFMRKELSEVP